MDALNLGERINQKNFEDQNIHPEKETIRVVTKLIYFP